MGLKQKEICKQVLCCQLAYDKQTNTHTYTNKQTNKTKQNKTLTQISVYAF